MSRSTKPVTCSIDFCGRNARHWIRIDETHPQRRTPICHRHFRAFKAVVGGQPRVETFPVPHVAKAS